MGKEKLNSKELEERVAVLKRFRSLLKSQRDKFSEYLFVLEKQEEDISQNNVERMLSHNDAGNAIIQNILSIQKVIEPIEKMYGLLNLNRSDEGVFSLKSDLARLQQAVLKQNEKNRCVLQNSMSALHREMMEFPLKNGYKKNVYVKGEEVANYVDVSY